MKLNLTFSLIVCMLITSQARSADNDALQGVWSLQRIEAKGENRPIPPGSHAKMSGDQMTVVMGERTSAVTYNVNDKREPKRFDTADLSVEDRITITPGIYKIEGDIFTLCIAGTKLKDGEPVPDPRPTAFDSRVGTLMIWKRVGKAPPATADAPVNPKPVFRTWTSADGKFSKEATLVTFASGIAQLVDRTGKSMNVPYEKLSAADKAYLDAWKK